VLKKAFRGDGLSEKETDKIITKISLPLLKRHGCMFLL